MSRYLGGVAAATSDEPRQPGMRRILDAMRMLREEAPGLLEQGMIAAAELAKSRGDGGDVPQ